MLIHLQFLPSLFSLLLLLCITTYADTTTTIYYPKDYYLINFGLSKSSTQPSNDGQGTWQSDEDFLVSPPSTTNPTTTVVGQSPPYDKARIIRASTTYSFPLSSWGPKLIRLYLLPPPLSSSYNTILDNTTNSFLSLTINKHEVLRNFSAYLVAANANAKTNTTAPVSRGGLVREVYVTVNERDGPKAALNLTFTPSKLHGFGFIYGLEITSMPDELYVNRSSGMQVPYLTGNPNDYFDNFYKFSSSLAMENIIRLNVGGATVLPINDTGIGRTWYEDQDYIVFLGTDSTTYEYNDSLGIHYTVTPPYTAPHLVYSTVRIIGSYASSLKKKMNLNLTWQFDVDGGFDHLVRLHFCELDRWVNQTQLLVFDIYINQQKASESFDVFGSAGGIGIPIYRDFVTFVDNSSGSKNVLSVALVPNPDTRFDDALLNGLEIFKLNLANGSLAAPNPAFSFPVSPNNPTRRSQSSSHLVAIIGGIVGLILVSLLVLVCFMIINRRKKAKLKVMNTMSLEDGSKMKWISPLDDSTSLATTTSVGSSLPSDLCRRFSLTQIKVATSDFDENLIIGTGGFGKVYKGSIDGGATTVAIKRLNPSSKQGAREFQTEIEMLSRLRHVHLVSLIGYCEDQGEMILVYEYMPRGTLRDHLLYKNAEKNNTPLSWKQRLIICVGSARGLHYLHSGAKQLIIHRDVKSTNILIDDKWTAKVSDFGLSKVGPDAGEGGLTHVSTAVKGSVGYLDPEYYRSQQLTEKSDVYSFGVVLFEVLCARPAMNPNLPRDQINLAMWARSHYKSGTLNTIVDPNLTGQIAPECLRKFGEIADMCVRDHGSERPLMGDVVWGLEFALQLQETAEKINNSGDVLEENLDQSSISLNAGDGRIISNYNDAYTRSVENFSHTSGVDSGENRLLDSRTTTSNSSNWPVDMISGSAFSEIIDPKAR